MKNNILFFVMIIGVNFLFSDTYAVTRDGRNILLKDDGTWKLITNNNQNNKDNKKFDFRNSKWGDSKQDVLSSETAKPIQMDDSNILAYETNVGGLDAFAAYYFTNNILHTSVYLFDETHSNKNLYLSDLGKIKNILIEKYGDPIDERIEWLNDLYADDVQEYGTAISIGHLIYVYKWETLNTSIELSLTGDNYKINHKIRYFNEKLREESKKIELEIDKSQF